MLRQYIYFHKIQLQLRKLTHCLLHVTCCGGGRDSKEDVDEENRDSQCRVPKLPQDVTDRKHKTSSTGHS